MDTEQILAGLNREQRRAAEALRGPVCILAGAGSGKTTTITHRIANQVASGAVRAEEILAVTFTAKAAAELRSRLAALGATGVTARTFHAAALGQLNWLGGGTPGTLIGSKALPLRQLANALPRPYRFRPAGDLATEIEWAKNRRVTPDEYTASLGERTPPIPAELMARVFAQYEQRKRERGELDFEDVLELAIGLLDRDPAALEAMRSRFRAFTVDEYQDVNLLQQTLLDRWLGDRDDLCAVGDDYQSIYAFTGASPAYLLGLRERFPSAAVVSLEANYRSSPQILELANRLVPTLGGAEKVLRPTRGAGPTPSVSVFPSREAEGAAVVALIKALAHERVALEQIAIICRTNARLADFEAVLHDAGMPSQGSSLLGREAARRLVRQLRQQQTRAVGETVRELAEQAGWLVEPPERLGERELVRQADLGRLVRLAAAFDDGERSAHEFTAELERRFGPSGEARGVHLLTLHGAKGLEFEAVFLPRLEERELPIRHARSAAEIAEERRLLYVGLTRARTHLALSWSGKGSRFLSELGVTQRPPARVAEPADPCYAALKRWRRERSLADAVPAYVVFHNATLEEIASRRPRSLAELGQVTGVGPSKLGRYGDEVLAVLARAA